MICEKYAELGFSEPPEVIDETERSVIISKMLDDNFIEGLDYKNFAESQFAKGAITTAKDVFDLCKRYQYNIADAITVKSELNLSLSLDSVEKLIYLYTQYDAKLHEQNRIEFADQMAMLIELIEANNRENFLEQFGFHHIIVDEFQDSDRDQIFLLNKFTETDCFESLMVVGDDSQAIFGFRDTTPEYMINFERYINADDIDEINLVENHRSTPEIINFANEINSRNKNRVFKDLVATRPSGKPVITKGFFEKSQETAYVVNEIKKRIDEGEKPENIAVIVSNNMEVDEMAGLLEENGIPVVALAPLSIPENSRVKAAVGLYKAFNDPLDMKDTLVYANAYIGGGLLDYSQDDIKTMNESMREKVNELYKLPLPEEGKKEKLMEMFGDIDPNEDEIYQSFLNKIKTRSVAGMGNYIEDFLVFGKNSKYRRKYTYPGVVVTTAHSSKGLEWPIVFDMISGYFRGGRLTQNELEEKRRLLFVSSTRARDELIVTGRYTSSGSQSKGFVFNKFLREAFEANNEPFVSSLDYDNLYSEYLFDKKLRKKEADKNRVEKLLKKKD